MADITQLRFSQSIRRLLGIKATDTAQRAVNAVAPVWELQDIYRPETRAMRGERLMGLGNNLIITNVGPSFGLFRLIAPLNARAFVLKRVTLNINLPTSTTQPGLVFFSIGSPVGQITTPTVFGQYKDSRVQLVSGTNRTSTGMVVGSTGITVFTVGQANSAYFEQLFPAAAIVNTRLQVDNLDLVMNGAQLDMFVGADTAPIAAYTYNLFIEGHEYSPDAAELVGSVV